MNLASPLMAFLSPARHHLSHFTPLVCSLPIASSSRLPYRLSSTLAQPSIQSGLKELPPTTYTGSVAEDPKGKSKAAPAPETAAIPKPRRSVGLKAKKAAISMTPGALDRLRALLASPTEPKLLRIGVKSRGCAGMAYHLDYVSPPGGKFDEVVEQDGVRVLIDSKALFSIIGSRMDWRDNRLSAGFVFDK
ncbi:hypothetical protein P7C73_g4372, partial [Tremellales sp. Uapishka_1]